MHLHAVDSAPGSRKLGRAARRRPGGGVTHRPAASAPPFAGQCLAEALAVVRQQSGIFGHCEVKYAQVRPGGRLAGAGTPRRRRGRSFPLPDSASLHQLPGRLRLSAPLPWPSQGAASSYTHPYACSLPRSLPQGKGRPRPDVALAFPELGFHLLFDGAQQRLRLVEVHDATRLQVGAAAGAAAGLCACQGCTPALG